jgi:hypothetical protein
MIVERLLEQTRSDALCDACLAFAATVCLTEIRSAIASVMRVRVDFECTEGRCASCARQTLVTVLRGAQQ